MTERDEGSNMRCRTRGFSLIELLVVIAIILIIAAIAIPNLLKSRMAANESAAVANLRAIGGALVTYNALYPRCGYPDSLAKLGPGKPANNTQAGLLDSIMANDTFIKHGYRYTYALDGGVGDCVGNPGLDYDLEAQPVVQNKTGIRGFFIDSSNVVRADPDGDADSLSTPL